MSSKKSFQSNRSDTSLNERKISDKINNQEKKSSLIEDKINSEIKNHLDPLIENVDFIKFQRNEELDAKNNLIEKKLKKIDEELKKNEDKLKFMKLEEEYQKKKQKKKEIIKKRERIFDVLQKMEMGYHKKMKTDRKKNDGKTWERDCINSTYSNKTYDVNTKKYCSKI